MKKPVMLDAFCGVGGASVGYARAGFEVVGVDIDPQPDYPFKFIQSDAISYIAKYGHEYDAVHTSPPCQASATLTKGTNKGLEYPDFIPETREVLAGLNVPTVIENVPSAAIRNDITLCGEMFGLGVVRHRFFEIDNIKIDQPEHIKHRGRVSGFRHGEWFQGPYFAVYGRGGGKGTVAQWKEAMGIDWTNNRKSIAQAIPPAYTEYIGSHIIKELS